MTVIGLELKHLCISLGNLPKSSVSFQKKNHKMTRNLKMTFGIKHQTILTSSANVRKIQKLMITKFQIVL